MRKSDCLTCISIIGLLLLVVYFKKDKIPSVTTTEITNVTVIGATACDRITDEGSYKVSVRGICWVEI